MGLLPVALWTVGAFAATPAPAASNAESYPVRPVRLLIPFAPGGGNDFLGRLLGQKLADHLGQQFVIDNRAGAGGIIATDLVAKAAPDGYTLLLGFVAPLTIIPHVEKVPYDPLRDFAAAGMLASIYHVLVVHPSVPARSVKELIALAKAKPGFLSFGSAGHATPPHLIGELLKSKAGIDMVHIPYKGAAPAATAILSGETHITFASVPAVMQHVRANRLNALAVTSPKRSDVLPDVPTLAESGVRDLEVGSWYALLAPATPPRTVLARLTSGIDAVSKLPDYRQQLDKQAFTLLDSNPEAFPAFVKAELEKWGRVLKSGQIHAR